MAGMGTGAPSAPGAKLDRHIGPWGLLLTGVTGIIGSGWLFAALYAAQLAGPAAVISWLIGSALILTLAFIYAELGGMIPAAGALARIPYVALGPLGGFIGGWLCWIAYVAVVSPGGTALAYVGTSGRLNYSMAELKLFPAVFMRLNRYRVPAVAMIFNSALGIFILAPLPGWAQLAGFISSAAVLSLAIGPIALVALRHQAPDHARPFRLRARFPSRRWPSSSSASSSTGRDGRPTGRSW